MKTHVWALYAVVTSALAQGPNPPRPSGPSQPGPPPDGDALRTYLNLTDSQMRGMQQAGEQARRQAEEKARSLDPQIREKRAALDAQLAKGDDPAAVGKLMIEIRSLEKQIRDAHAAGRKSFVDGLNAEQKARFKSIEDAALLPQAAREALRMGLVPGARPDFQADLPQQLQQRMLPGNQMRNRMGQPNQGRGPNQPRPMIRIPGPPRPMHADPVPRDWQNMHRPPGPQPPPRNEQ